MILVWSKKVNQLIFIALVMFGSILSAQDLVTAWENYISIDAELARVMEKESLLKEQQNRLQEEIRDLQKNQSWYNGWINKMRRVRKSTYFLEISNSLVTTQGELTLFSRKRDEAFLSLKKAYKHLLLETDKGDQLSFSDKETAFSLGQWILNEGKQSYDFPDYASILVSNFEDDEIKRLVLDDLQSVLETKLYFIDSLLTENYSETELINRLNEFHRDLNLQMESDRDLSTGGTEEFAAINDYIEKEYIGNGDRFFFAGSKGATNEELGTVDVRSIQAQITRENQVESDINILELKRQQYQQLLSQIKDELAD